MDLGSPAAAMLALLALSGLAALPFLLDPDPEDATTGDPGQAAPGDGRGGTGHGQGDGEGGHATGGPLLRGVSWLFGWLAGLFDGSATTSSSSDPGGGPGDDATQDANAAVPQPPRLDLDLRSLLILVAIPLALLLTGLLARRYLKRAHHDEPPTTDEGHPESLSLDPQAPPSANAHQEHLIVQAYAHARRHLEAQGHAAQPDTTPTEYANALPTEHAEALKTLTRTYLAVRHGQREPTPQRARRARTLARTITQGRRPR